jgi:hypothetical protein
MTFEPPKFLRETGLAAAMATAAALPASAQDGVHGWDEPALAEFVMRDVDTRFTTGEPNVVRDVHVDCDLLVRDGQTLFLTTGFAIQFNAETQRTNDILGPQTIALLQTWRGQMDYREGRVTGAATHLASAHGITATTLVDAARTCKRDHFERAEDINVLGSDLESIHADYR